MYTLTQKKNVLRIVSGNIYGWVYHVYKYFMWSKYITVRKTTCSHTVNLHGKYCFQHYI